MAAPKSRLFSDSEAYALLLKARELGYPLKDEEFLNAVTIQQLDDMITYGRYDC